MHHYPTEVLRVRWHAQYNGNTTTFLLRAFSTNGDKQEHYPAVIQPAGDEDSLLQGIVVPKVGGAGFDFKESLNEGSGEPVTTASFSYNLDEGALGGALFAEETARKLHDLHGNKARLAEETFSAAVRGLEKAALRFPATPLKDVIGCTGASIGGQPSVNRH